MSQAVRELEPQAVWNHFADLNAVPRASKKEERVIQFMKEFGESLGLETLVDEVGNVIIKKPASKGMEDRVTIVMQSHLDMVHQKNADTEFDFETQGIDMYVDGDWVKARGTTLGADNGLGVASIMTLLSSTDIDHPALEALFTIDEETGMTGAQGLKGGLLDGKILLNLDTEEDNELTIGCAGGVDVTATGSYTAEDVPAGSKSYRVIVRGLKGGHSGVDIHLGRANANKLMNRLLWKAAKSCDLRIAEIDGGSLRNAIPRESFSVVVVPEGKAAEFESLIASEAAVIKSEYATTDMDAEILCESTDLASSVLPLDLQTKIIGTLYACPCGIHRMCPDIDDLVQTSNNLARVLVKDGEFTIGCLTRSSVNTERDDLANAITANFELTGASVEQAGAYPGWQPAPESDIVKLMSSLYEEPFKESAHVAACHAGLECGILGTNYPEMEMISFGPCIRGAHSPDERTQISSMQKFWGFLLETLKRIPKA
ncbi:MAG: aminoacyl-histidine dipeptidase [Planctomycetota bacterium]